MLERIDFPTSFFNIDSTNMHTSSTDEKYLASSPNIALLKILLCAQTNALEAIASNNEGLVPPTLWP